MGACCPKASLWQSDAALHKTQTRITNELDLEVDIWINEGGPFARVPPHGIQIINLKHVDPKTTRGKVTWKATHLRASTMHRGASHVVTVATGQAFNEFHGFLPIVVGSTMASIEGGLDLVALTRVIDVQIRWRATMLNRREMRARRRREAAIVIQSSARGRLARRPTTCFICLSEMAFGAKVSTVPSHQCHRICRSCARQYVDGQIADGRLYIRCPGEGCRQLMDPEAFASHDAINKYRVSLRASHRERVAAETDAEFVGFATSQTRACPACGVLIWRSGGCDHMHCRCGNHFQWTDQAAQVSRTGSDVEGDEVAEGNADGAQSRAEVALPDDPEDGLAPLATRDDEIAHVAIERFAGLPGNEVCHDCGSHAFGAENPPWVSLSYGVVLCLECAGHHRSMGSHISAVRSVTLDELPPAEATTLVLAGGNRALGRFVQEHVEVPWVDMGVDERREWYRSATDARAYRQRVAALRDTVAADLDGTPAARRAEGTSAPTPAWLLERFELGPAPDGARARREVLRALVYLARL